MVSTLIGISLIAVPIIVFQSKYPDSSLDRITCTFLGGIGGALMASRCDKNALGFRWLGGVLGGGLTSNLAYYGSELWFTLQGEDASFNIFIIMVCSIPGLIAYAGVKRCSDRTFIDYRPLPTSLPDENQATSGTGNTRTPLLLGHRV